MAWFYNLGFRWKTHFTGCTSGHPVGDNCADRSAIDQPPSEDVNRLADEFLPGLNSLLQADRDLYQALVAERSMIFVDTNWTSIRSRQRCMTRTSARHANAL